MPPCCGLWVGRFTCAAVPHIADAPRLRLLFLPPQPSEAAAHTLARLQKKYGAPDAASEQPQPSPKATRHQRKTAAVATELSSPKATRHQRKAAAGATESRVGLQTSVPAAKPENTEKRNATAKGKSRSGRASHKLADSTNALELATSNAGARAQTSAMAVLPQPTLESATSSSAASLLRRRSIALSGGSAQVSPAAARPRFAVRAPPLIASSTPSNQSASSIAHESGSAQLEPANHGASVSGLSPILRTSRPGSLRSRKVNERRRAGRW